MEVLYILQIYVKEHIIKDYLSSGETLFTWLKNVEDFSKPMFYTSAVIGALSNKLVDARTFKTPSDFDTLKKIIERMTFIEKTEIRKISLELLKDA